MPPGILSASFARWSATRKLRASSSRTQGPAITNSASSRKTGASVTGLRERPSRLAPLALRPGGGGDEPGEKRVRTRGSRLELGMELAADEPRMWRILDDLDELAIRAHSTQAEPVLHELLPVRVRHLIAMPMALADLRDAVHFGNARAARESCRIGA